MLQYFIFQSLEAFVGSLGFALLFNVQGSNLWLSALGGMLGWQIYLLAPLLFSDSMIVFFLASLVVTLYSELMAWWRKAPATVFLIAAIIPLVPGTNIFYTMQQFVRHNHTEAFELLVETFSIAGAIALGSLSSSFSVRLIKPKLHQLKKRSLAQKNGRKI